jgi:hypothetical protein
VQFKLGKDAVAYFGTVRATWGTLDADGYSHAAAAPSGLTAINKLKDLTLNLDKGSADVTTRGNNGFTAEAVTLKTAEITGVMIYDPTDAGVSVILKSYFTDSVVPFAFLDGDKATAGTTGLWADCQVHKLEKGEPIDGAQTLNVTIKPTLTAVPPEWIKVGA